MSVDPAGAKERVEYMGATHYFCSAGCRSKFEKDPARYTAQVVQLEPAGQFGHSNVMAAMPKKGEIDRQMERHTSATDPIDPICGMSVDPDHAEYRSFQKGVTYYFCSAGCKETFDKNPNKYIKKES
jgi:Cu+-exporting ATPase